MAFGFLKRQSNSKPSSRQTTHTVSGRQLPLVIRSNPRAKRLTLRIEPGGRGLKITVPPGIGEREIDTFLARQESWLTSKLDLVPDETVLRIGHKVPIRGVNHLIVHQQGRGMTHLRDGPDGPEIIVYGERRFAARRVADHLKKLAKTDIPPLVAHHTKAVDRKAKAVRYKDTKSRWGSCSSDANLNFSWRIMMAPPTVINYLVAHEVAHLVHMDHSPRFWALTEKICPDMKRAKDWLKRNGSKLQAVGFG